MGDRGQVLIKDKKVYLYTHWEGGNLKKTVRTALARKERWDDPEYLARIIFCEMVRGREKEETGFGIGTSEHGDLNNPLITIDCKKNSVYIGGLSWRFNNFIKGHLRM